MISDRLRTWLHYQAIQLEKGELDDSAKEFYLDIKNALDRKDERIARLREFIGGLTKTADRDQIKRACEMYLRYDNKRLR